MYNLQYAQQLDANDALKKFRSYFHIPTDGNGNELIYLCGNSLGLQPKKVAQYLQEELEDWQKLGVEGHTQARRPWLSYHEEFTDSVAKIVGAKAEEVVLMNGLTVNLHLLMLSFYKPSKQRYKIIIESAAFPSDKYAVASQLRLHGYSVDEGLIELQPIEGKEYMSTKSILESLEKHKDEAALLLLGGVNYYTGEVIDMPKICQFAQSLGIIVGYDLAHAVGNVPLYLHDWGVDFAAWCNYKYLNGGPGATAAAFIHEKHLNNPNINRLEGWWGHDKATRFKMPDQFKAIPTAEAWQLSNAPVFSMAPIRASLDIFDQVSMTDLRAKSIALTGFLYDLLQLQLKDKVTVLTPTAIEQRGCQLSLSIGDKGKAIFNELTLNGVIADWREPSVIRIAPVPLYNTFEDVYNFVQRLAALL